MMGGKKPKLEKGLSMDIVRLSSAKQSCPDASAARFLRILACDIRSIKCDLKYSPGAEKKKQPHEIVGPDLEKDWKAVRLQQVLLPPGKNRRKTAIDFLAGT